MMTLEDFLARVIGDGIEAARRDYVGEEKDRKLAGSIAGFEACRGRSPSQLATLLAEARLETREAIMEKQPKDWYWRCRELEIEWVCNCMSAALMNVGEPVIMVPTARGVMKAAEILGVKEAA